MAQILAGQKKFESKIGIKLGTEYGKRQMYSLPGLSEDCGGMTEGAIRELSSHISTSRFAHESEPDHSPCPASSESNLHQMLHIAQANRIASIINSSRKPRYDPCEADYPLICYLSTTSTEVGLVGLDAALFHQFAQCHGGILAGAQLQFEHDCHLYRFNRFRRLKGDSSV